eukprot:scaffold43347_cov81-Phaeocystis_antarctica.AAC.1
MMHLQYCNSLIAFTYERRIVGSARGAPPDMSSYAAGVARARGRARLRRAAEQGSSVPRTATTRRLARQKMPLGTSDENK